MSNRLRRRFSISVIGIIICVAVVLSLGQFILSVYDQRQLQTEQSVLAQDTFQEQIEVLQRDSGARLARVLVNPLYYEDMDQIEELAQLSVGSYYNQSILIEAPDGRVLQRYPDSFEGEYRAAALPSEDLAKLMSGELLTYSTRESVVSITPIVLGDQVLGFLQMQGSPVSAAQVIDFGSTQSMLYPGSTNLVYWLMVSIATVCLAVFGLLFVRRASTDLTDPLAALTKTAHEIGKGNYQVEPDINRQDELGELAEAISEMSENLRAQYESVQYLAYHDPLTGQCNRISFQNFLEAKIDPNSSEIKSAFVLMLDLDDFRVINDLRSHEAGDRTLKIAASRIDDTLRKFELDPRNTASEILISRTGGDEFAVVITDPWKSSLASELADQLVVNLSKPYRVDNTTWRITVSVGIARYPDDDPTPNGLINCANMALFHSKITGKGKVSEYAQINHQDGLNGTRIKEDFKLAMASDNDELFLNYQPIINLTSGRITGAESLLRWNHPALGPLSPAQFIPLIEHSELAHDTDLWVIRKACEMLEKVQQVGSHFKLSANISVANLVRENFPDSIAQILNETGARPSQLYLEITESYLFQDEDRAHKNILRIRDLGVEVWLDDFGTGFSSLSHLRNLTVEGIKIDQTFVNSLGEQLPDRAMVSAMIALATAFDIGIIAEGIETREQAEILQTLGCRMGQGWLFAKALPEQQLVDEISASRNFFQQTA